MPTLDERIEAVKALIEASLRFAYWAAGEGIVPIDGPDGPEDFLMEYSLSVDDQDWETLADRVPALLAAERERLRKALQEQIAFHAMDLTFRRGIADEDEISDIEFRRDRARAALASEPRE